MPPPKGIQVRIGSDSKPFRKDLKKTETSLAAFGRSAKGISGAIGGGLAAAAKLGAQGLAAITAGASAGVAELRKLDKGAREITTLFKDFVHSDIPLVKSQLEELSVVYGQEIQTVAKAYYDSISAGIPREDVIIFLNEAAKFATGGVTDMTKAVDIMTSASNAFQISAREASIITDTLFGTVRDGKTTVDELAASFYNVGPVAAAVGAEIEEVSAWLARLTLMGTPTAEASTQIRAALTELSRSNRKGGKSFKELMGMTFHQAVANDGLFETFRKLNDIIIENDVNLLAMFGRIEAGQSIIGISRENWADYERIMNNVRDATGSANEAFEIMAEGMDFKFKSIKQQFKQVLRQLGEAFLPAIERAVPALLSLGEAFVPLGLELLNMIVPAFEQVAPLLSELGFALIPALNETVEALLPLLPLVELAVIGISESADEWARVMEDLAPALADAGAWLGDAVGLFRDAEDAVAGSGGAFRTAGGDLWYLLGALRELTDNALVNAIIKSMELRDVIDEWLVGSLVWLHDVMLDLRDVGTDFVNVFKDVAEVFKDVGGVFQGAWGSVSGWARSAWSAVGGFIGDDTSAQEASDLFRGIGGAVSGGLGRVAGGGSGMTTVPSAPLLTRANSMGAGVHGMSGVGVPSASGSINVSFNGPVYGDTRQLGNNVVRALEDWVRTNGSLPRSITR